MKIEEHSELWHAIQQFPLDDPKAAITFSHKLAAKQNWSPTFTERVIEEYRKFLLLCCISPNGASPSEAVDEAWHLHLTYTRSYWIDLCKNTLGKDIHHHPSRGGNEEDHKHRNWYAATLGLYQSVFGSPPPNNIWPPPRQQERPISEPAWGIRKEVRALVVLLLMLPLIVSAYLYHVLSPFSLKGPQFLLFFPLLAFTCIICYVILQNEKGRLLKELVASHFPTNASAFQIARFLYGQRRTVQTAIVDLIRRNLMAATPDKRFMVYKKRYSEPPHEQNPLIAGFLSDQYDEYDSINYETIVNSWYNEEAAKHPALQRLYALAYNEEPFFKRYHVLIIPFGMSMCRLVQGAARGKPVGFLIAETVVLFALCALITWLFSKKKMILDTAKKLAMDKQIIEAGNNDIVVTKFSLNGNIALVAFAEGALLASIFAPAPVILTSLKRKTNPDYSSCGGGGCSGGGCGSSCGGGCGGGCGGCGGD